MTASGSWFLLMYIKIAEKYPLFMAHYYTFEEMQITWIFQDFFANIHALLCLNWGQLMRHKDFYQSHEHDEPNWTVRCQLHLTF